MSPQASKRTGAAASRGGAGSPPPGGFLQSPSLSPTDVNAAQARSRANRFIQSRPASATTTRRMPNFGRGAAPRPLSGMGIGARLAADQARDRRTAQDQPTSNIASPATNGETLLELPTRSYTRPEPTSEERWADKQKEMMKRKEQFQTSEGAAEAAPGGGEGATQARATESPQQQNTDRNRRSAEPEGFAQQLLEEQQQDRQTEWEQEEATEAIKAAARQERDERIRKNRRARNIAKLIQLVTSFSIITAITLLLQMNAEMLNKWIFKKRIPWFMEVEENPKIGWEEMTTLGINFCAVFAIVGYAFQFIVPFGMAYAASNPVQTVFFYLKNIFFPGL